MNKKYTNNHFLQKAFVKNFASNKIVKWIKYKTDEKGVFNIQNTSNEKQPISIKNFYSCEIEIKMNNLESEGITVIKKIALEEQSNKNIALSRKELLTLKFYSILTSARTQKLRENIKIRSGSSYFNEIMKNDGRSSKEIQEEVISLILKYWKTNREEWTGDVKKRLKKIQDYKNLENNNKSMKKMTIELFILNNILEQFDSRVLIFKFDKSKLFLTESLNFVEINKKTEEMLLNFMPITPNIGIAFYFDPFIKRGDHTEKSTIFKNDVSYPRHKVEYENWEQMEKERITFLKKHKHKNFQELEKLNITFSATNMNKHRTENDKYIYEVLKESEETADFCNAMFLVHNKNHILIYQNYKDINDAEIQVQRKRIFRIGDYQ